MSTVRTPQQEMAADMGGFTHDPLGYVLYAFPWGQGELQGIKGPRRWQRRKLEALGAKLRAAATEEARAAATGLAIREAVASGHGIGKSALVSMLVLWALSTCEDARVVVTANTESQLKVKTWAELAKWHRLAINKDWFTFTATALYSSDPAHEKTWRADMVPWNENKPESFAGLHNQGRRILVIFDEASAIANVIWDVTEGAMTDADTEIIWLVFGNPTRNTGKFFECFNKSRNRWSNENIDSREVEGTNKAELQAWVDEYGEDSDFVRVRVRGQFPRASAVQFIPLDLVQKAQQREPFFTREDPLIMTLDISRGGDDNCVFRFRRGLDAKSIPARKIPGSEVRDSMKLVSIAVDLVNVMKPDYFFFDETGVGGPVGDRIRQLGYTVMGVQFGSSSPDPHYANMRAYIWARGRQWLEQGGAIDSDPQLLTDLTAPEYSHNSRDQLVLEPKAAMKKRGLASPDDGDAFCMSFAFPVGPKTRQTQGGQVGVLQSDWDPLDPDRA